ncbi:MAG: oligopeptide:H+ symporter [Gammaproteobacteria bacterium]
MNNNIHTSNGFLGQPRGFVALCFMTALLMFSFGVIQSLAVLYLTKTFGLSDHDANTLFAAYYALIYCLPIVGGYLGGRFLGYSFAVIIGSLLGAVGLLVLWFHNLTAVYIGLALFVVGTATFVPNYYVLLGRIYHLSDHRRETGFTLSYMAMNMGGFIAVVLSGYLVQIIGYHLAFLLGAIALLGVLVVFAIGRRDFISSAAESSRPVQPDTRVFSLSGRAIGVVLTVLTIPVICLLLNHAALSNNLLLLVGAVCVGIVIKMAFREPNVPRQRMLAFLILSIVAVAFWALYGLAPTLLTLFVDRNVDRHIGSLLLPASTLIGLNPFFIVTVGAVFSVVWLRLAKHDRSPSLPAKFALGILSMAAGYLVLLPSVHSANSLGYISVLWIVLSYFFQTTGELFLSPIGYSMVGVLIPPRHESFMVGIWQLATGIGCALSSYLADFATSQFHTTNPLTTNPIYAHSFFLFGAITAAVGILMALFIPSLKKLILGSKL